MALFPSLVDLSYLDKNLWCKCQKSVSIYPWEGFFLKLVKVIYKLTNLKLHGKTSYFHLIVLDIRFTAIRRLSFTRTRTTRVAGMSVTATALTSTPTWAAVTQLGWRAAPGWSTRGQTTWATSTSWPEASTLTTRAGVASTTESAPARWFTL